MKYKLIADNDYKLNIEEFKNIILKRRGIKDTVEFFNLGKHNIDNIENYDNMELGHKTLIKNINKIIGILVDCDVDGYSSATYQYKYIKDINPNAKITYFLHEGKEHGLTDKKVFEQILNSNIDLLIVPDAGSGDFEQHKTLKEIGIDVIVIDHHSCDKGYSPYAVVINNQLSNKVINKNLSGVGVVHKFCKYIDKQLQVNYADKYLDLLMLGNIADVIDLKELETRYLVQQGLQYINNDFIKALLNNKGLQYEIGKRGINIMSVGWVIVPKINAIIRNATMEDKINMFRAFIGEYEMSERTYRGETIIETLQERMARIGVNSHNTQNNKTKKGMEIIEQYIKENSMEEDKVIIVDCTGILDKTLTGLVANKLVSKYKRPIILLQNRKDKQGVYGGSARSYNSFAIQDFRQFCLQTNQFNKCEGHDNAFGIEINKDNVEELKKYFNKELKDIVVDLEETYIVDYIIDMKHLTKEMVKEIGLMKDVWGNKIDEPYFVIKNIKISSKKIQQLGEKKNFVKFEVNGIDFLKEYASQEFFDTITLKPKKGFNKEKTLNLTILGKFKINEWEGKVKPQIEIIDYEVQEDDDFVW